MKSLSKCTNGRGNIRHHEKLLFRDMRHFLSHYRVELMNWWTRACRYISGCVLKPECTSSFVSQPSVLLHVHHAYSKVSHIIFTCSYTSALSVLHSLPPLPTLSSIPTSYTPAETPHFGNVTLTLLYTILHSRYFTPIPFLPPSFLPPGSPLAFAVS